MFDVGLLDILFDKSFLAMMAVSILAFATVATLALPLLEKSGLDDRLKSVSKRREELRARHHATLNAKRGSLRVEPSTWMKGVLDRFKLGTSLESDNSREKLAMAGYRGQAPLIAFMFFRFVMPFVVFGVALVYLFLLTNFHWAFMMKVTAAVAGALFGYYLPDIFVSNMIQKRQVSIMQAFPDALDLMAGLDQVLRHRQAHIAEPDESNPRHGVLPFFLLRHVRYHAGCSCAALSASHR